MSDDPIEMRARRLAKEDRENWDEMPARVRDDYLECARLEINAEQAMFDEPKPEPRELILKMLRQFQQFPPDTDFQRGYLEALREVYRQCYEPIPSEVRS